MSIEDYEWSASPLKEGDLLESRAAGEKLLCAQAESDGKTIHFSQARGVAKSSTRLYSGCSDGRCSYSVRIAAQCTNNKVHWKVLRCTPHTCNGRAAQGPKIKTHCYSAGVLARVLEPVGPKGYRTEDVKRRLAHYVSGGVSAPFARRVAAAAVLRNRGHFATGLLPAFAHRVNQSGYGTLTVHSTGVHGQCTYAGFSYCSKGVQKMNLISEEGSVTFSDGTHCQVGTILTTLTCDAGRHIVPLCITHVIGNESEETWATHFRELLRGFPNFNSVYTVDISDGDKGVAAAIQRISPLTRRFRCQRHRYANLELRHGKVVANTFRKMVYACTDSQFNRHAKSLTSEKGMTAINAVPHENQFLLPAFKAGIMTRGWSTTSVAESYNQQLKVVRFSRSPLEMAVDIVGLVEQQLYNRAADVEAHACTSALLPPLVRDRLACGGEGEKDPSKYEVEIFGNRSQAKLAERAIAKVYFPGHFKHAKIVSMRAGEKVTCSCNRSVVVDGPFCVHLAAMAKSTRFDLSPFVPLRDTIHTWQAQYRAYEDYVGGCGQIPDASYLEGEHPPGDPLRDPQEGPKKRGRPKKNYRRRTLHEILQDSRKRAVQRCGQCGGTGHTKRRCKAIIK